MWIDPHRARLRQWQAANAWRIPNSHQSPLHEAERMAENDGEHLREAAKATGNRPLLACIDALRIHAIEKRIRRPGHGA